MQLSPPNHAPQEAQGCLGPREHHSLRYIKTLLGVMKTGTTADRRLHHVLEDFCITVTHGLLGVSPVAQ